MKVLIEMLNGETFEHELKSSGSIEGAIKMVMGSRYIILDNKKVYFTEFIVSITIPE